MEMANEPGTYEHAVERFDEFSDKAKTRLIRDSAGDYHKLELLPYVIVAFEELTGRNEAPEGEVFFPDPDVSRALIDEALLESKRTSLPLSMCFQSLVLERVNERTLLDIDRKLRDERGE